MISPKSAVTNAHSGTDRPKGRAARGLYRDDSLLLGDVAPVMPSSVGGERATPDTRRGRLVVNFHERSGMGSLATLWPIDASTWIILPPCGDIFGQKFAVEFRAIDEPSEMVREGRNLALGTRTSMGLTSDNVPTMMCGLSDRLCTVTPVSLAEHIEHRIAQKLPEWRPLSCPIVCTFVQCRNSCSTVRNA